MIDLIEELKKQEADLSRLLAEVRGIGQEYVRLASEKHGVKPGSIVKDKGGKIYRVVKIDPFETRSGKPWVIASPQKKDGGFSKRSQTVYNWELVE